MDIKLKMPITEYDGQSGINDGNIETFKNKMLMSLTKEELQNSVDNAQISSNGETERVTVEFHDYYLPIDELPEKDALLNVFNDEKQFWDGYMTTDKKAVKFFDKGIKLLKGQNIRCLRISDFNTTGLTGIKAQQASPWHNLVNNRGVSDKPASATGSFGIGKDAAFACSDLRTVFYSTYNIDDIDNKAFQGSLKLPTYKKGDVNYVGYASFAKDDGKKKAEPIMECLSLDPEYKRTEHGMDKYIIGFFAGMSQEDLKREIVASSINNFLCAFWNDKLVLKYGDITVDKAHLEKIIQEFKKDLDKVTIEYYETLKAPDKAFTISVIDENDVEIYVRLMENAERRAAIVRKSGMKVFDKNYISKRIEFAAVVILTGDKANEFFKALENPEHTGWSDDRASNKALMKANQNKIFDALRNAVSDLQQENASDVVDADGVSEYLPLAYVTGKRKKIEGLSNEIESKKKASKKKKKKNNSVEQKEEITYEEDEQGNIIDTTIDVSSGTEGGSGQNSGTGGTQGGNGEGEGSGTGGTGNRGDTGDETDEEPGQITGTESKTGKYIAKRKIPNSSFRFVMNTTNDVYHLKAIGEKNIRSGFIEIRISSEENTFVIPLKSAFIDGKTAEFSVNKISFGSLEANVKHDISFTFKRPGVWTVEVSIYEN